MGAEPRLLHLLDEQREWIAAADVAARQSVEALLVQARLEMVERMERALHGLGEEAFTTQLMRASLVQVDGALAQLRGQMEQDLGARVADAAQAGGDGILAQVKLMEGGVPLPMRLDLATAIQQGSQLRMTGAITRYGAGVVTALEQRLGVILLARVPRHIAIQQILEAAGEELGGSRWRAALIYRNELSAAYDAATRARHADLAQSIAARGTDPLLSRMDEAIDLRTHPFSRVAHGTVADVGQPWRVDAGEVATLGKGLKLGASGILWSRDGEGYYAGYTYPAHHNDRGRRTAWRRAWGDPKEI